MNDDPFSRLTEALLARDPRQSGNDYICPAHDDSKPSLGVTRKNGKVLVKCAAGCLTKNVLAAVPESGVTMRDLSPNGRTTTPTRQGTSARKEQAVTEADVKSWNAALNERHKTLGFARRNYLTEERMTSREVLDEYQVGWDASKGAYTIPIRDADGDLVSLKRYRPDRDPKSTWLAGHARTDLLYPLDQLDDANDVVLCEGEWDALVLIGMGIAAVTMLGGAGAGKWNPEWAKLFSGKRVAICTDCDKAGRDTAREAAESLANYARLVYVMDLGGDDGYDVTNFFQDDSTVEDFWELMLTSRTQAPHRLHLISAWDRLERLENEDPPKWRFRPFFMEGTYGALAAPEKAGKTWDADAMSVAAVSGEKLWGLVPVDTTCDVAMFVGEDDEWLTIQRLQAICDRYSLDHEEILRHIHFVEAVPRFGDEHDMDAVRRELERLPDVGLTNVDPMYLAAKGADGGQIYGMAEYLSNIQQVVVNEARSDLMVVHHWNQSGRGSGPERFAGAGLAEWGRVLMSGKPDALYGGRGGWTKRTMDYEISGSRIPKIKLKVTRRIRQLDPTVPTSPYQYEAEAEWVEGMTERLSVLLTAVVGALPWEQHEAMTTAEVTRTVSKTLAKKQRDDSVRKALRKLRTDHQMVTYEDGRWWRV